MKVSSNYFEELALSAMIAHEGTNVEKLISLGVTEECFHAPHTKNLFLVINELYEKKIVGSEAIQEHLIISGLISNSSAKKIRAISADIWMRITGRYQNSQQVEMVSKELKKFRLLRELYTEVSGIKDLLEDNGDPSEILQKLTDRIDELAALDKKESTIKDSETAAREFIKKLQDSAAGNNAAIIETNIKCIDGINGGARRGEFWVIGGETSAGKSVLGLQITAAFIKNELRSLLFSLEMEADQIIARLISCMMAVPMQVIQQPRSATKGDMLKIDKWLRRLQETQRLFIDDDAESTIDEICAKAKELHKKEPLDLVVVDYIQLVSGSANEKSREQEIAKISRKLKQLSKTLKCVVIGLTQLNDDGKTRESRAIANDADVILIITKDGLAVVKYRNGQKGMMLPLYLNGAVQTFHQPV